MEIKQHSADIQLNSAAGSEELMELLSLILISVCVGGLPFPFYLPSPPLSTPQQHSATHCSVAVFKITRAAVAQEEDHWYPSVYVCVYECLEKHVVMNALKTCCMSVCEWVNVACSVRSALSGQLD